MPEKTSKRNKKDKNKNSDKEYDDNSKRKDKNRLVDEDNILRNSESLPDLQDKKKKHHHKHKKDKIDKKNNEIYNVEEINVDAISPPLLQPGSIRPQTRHRKYIYIYIIEKKQLYTMMEMIMEDLTFMIFNVN